MKLILLAICLCAVSCGTGTSISFTPDGVVLLAPSPIVFPSK